MLSLCTGFKGAKNPFHFPVHSKVVSTNTNSLWFDKECLHERSVRKQLQNSNNKAAYNTQKRYCAYLAKKKQTDYYSSLVAEVSATNNQALIFKLLKKLTGCVVNTNDNLPVHSSKSTLANDFNTSFSHKVLDIRRSIGSSQEPLYIAPSENTLPSSLSSFSPTTVEEIII